MEGATAQDTKDVGATAGTEGDKPEQPVRKVQKNKKRCFKCRKKVGLVGIECRCGYVFCGACRYPDVYVRRGCIVLWRCVGAGWDADRPITSTNVSHACVCAELRRHNCDFDFKAMERAALAKANNKVEATCIDNI